MGKGKVKKLKAPRIKSQAQSKNRSLVLTGFMGTGKTSVGRIVAARLGREFVDMDSVIEAQEGKLVREIFETQGERYFRARESELCVQLSPRNDLVIATGGGALIDAKNRECFKNAFVVCLDASVNEILDRLDGAANRPLLADGDTRHRVEELLVARQPAYSKIEHHLDTAGTSIQQVADKIVLAFEEATR